jgi:hypothetical protein
MVTMSGPLWTSFSTQVRIFRKIDIKVFQDVGGNPTPFFDQAQQDMFGANVLVIESLSFLIGQLHHFAGPVGKTFVHICSPYNTCSCLYYWVFI